MGRPVRVDHCLFYDRHHTTNHFLINMNPNPPDISGKPEFHISNQARKRDIQSDALKKCIETNVLK